MARSHRRKSRRSLGGLGFLGSGSLLLWGGAALVAWLLLKPKKDELAPKDQKVSRKDIEKRRPTESQPKSEMERFGERIASDLDKSKLERVHKAAMDAFFGPLWDAGMLEGYVAKVCFTVLRLPGSPKEQSPACVDSMAYLNAARYEDEKAQHEERGDDGRMAGLGAPLKVPGPGITVTGRKLRLFNPLAFEQMGLPKEYAEPYYAHLMSYLKPATFEHVTVVRASVCAADESSAACKLVTDYWKKKAPPA